MWEDLVCRLLLLSLKGWSIENIPASPEETVQLRDQVQGFRAQLSATTLQICAPGRDQPFAEVASKALDAIAHAEGDLFHTELAELRRHHIGAQLRFLRARSKCRRCERCMFGSARFMHCFLATILTPQGDLTVREFTLAGNNHWVETFSIDWLNGGGREHREE